MDPTEMVCMDTDGGKSQLCRPLQVPLKAFGRKWPALSLALLITPLETTVLRADSVTIQSVSGAFSMTGSTTVQSNTSSAANPLTNLSFSVATPGYFLFNGVTGGGNVAPSMPNSGGAGVSASPGAVTSGLGLAPLGTTGSSSGSGTEFGTGTGNPSTPSFSSGGLGSLSQTALLTDTDSPSGGGLPADVPSVPEPSTVWLVGLGLTAVGLLKHVLRRG